MRLFSRQAVGIDIDERSIEVVALGSSGAVTHAARATLSPGLIERGVPKDTTKLAKAIRDTLAAAKPEPIQVKDVYATLPDEIVFTSHFELKVVSKESDEEKEERIVEALLRHIPFRAEEVSYTYQVVRTEGGFMSIIVAAAAREHVQAWVALFRAAGLRLSRFDIELIAQYRTIFAKYPKEPVLLVDIGATRTSFGLFTALGIEHTHTIAIGGSDITSSIAQALDIPEKKAETEKKKKEILDFSNQAAAPTIKVLERISNHIEETVEYYKSDKKIEVSSIVLTGGTSNLSGIEGYLTENTGVTVTQAAVSDDVVGKETPKTITHPKNRVVYIEAIGAALLGQRGARPGDLLITPAVIRASKKKKPPITEEEKDTPDDEKKEEPEKEKTPNKKRKLSKLEIEIGVLGILVIVGIFGIWWAVGYREDQRTIMQEQQLLELQQTLEDYAQEQGTSLEEVAEIATTREEEEEPIPQIEILSTPTGWLRVRGGPSTSFEQVDQVNTGEVYPLIEESAGWYNISIAEDLTGWVFSEYAQILEDEQGASEEE